MRLNKLLLRFKMVRFYLHTENEYFSFAVEKVN